MPDENKPGEVEVDLDKAPEKTPEEKEAEKLTKINDQLEKLGKTVNYLSANRRHEDGLSKKVDEIYEKLNTKEPDPEPVEMDELDQIAQKDWKKGVGMIVEQVFEKREKERKESENTSKIQEYNSGILERSKDKVRDRHPEIESDPTSDKARIFKKILAENPDYINNPRGPELAMRDMEEELRNNGVIDPNTNRLIEKEADRRTRIVKTNVSKDNAVSENKITLTKDDQEFCKLNNIPYDEFAKNKKTLSGGGKEGVEV